MDDIKKNIHEGHRKRIKEQFIKDEKLDTFPDHNILELLLFYSTPRADTNVMAHELINRFGSLNGVFDAPYGALKEINGIGEHSAILLKLIPETVKRYMKNKNAEKKHILSEDEAVEYLRPFFDTLKKESLVAVCLNNAGKILKTVIISEGATDFTQVDTRKLIEETLFCNATQVILAHKHPGGISVPSQADIMVTNRIALVLQAIHARLANHIIICENDHFSFAKNPKFASLFLAEDAWEVKNLAVSEGDFNDRDN